MAKKLAPIHPGTVLKEEFMTPYELSANRLAGLLDVPANRISQIVAGRREITADTAIRLAKLFGMSDRAWLALQAQYELDVAEDLAEKSGIYENIERYAAA